MAQGGDWGAIITDLMAAQAPPGLIGMHTNMPAVVPPEIDKVLWAGSPPPSGLSADEKLACDMLAVTYKNVRYAFYMASRPQTLYAIADSPVGLAAWLHDPIGLDMTARSFDGVPEGLTRDDVLDNCTLFWLTNTGVSASRLYRENTFNYFTPKGVNIPVAVSVFPDELYQAPRSWAEKAYPKLVHFNKVAKGGHFGDWTMGRQAIVSSTPAARIVHRFHARDLHLVMGPSRRDSRVRFRVAIDGRPPGPARGVDVGEGGNGTILEQRLYQLIRQPKPIVDRQFEIEFLDGGAEAYAFTFG